MQAKQVFTVIYYVLCGAVAFVLFQIGLFKLLSGFVKPLVGTFDKLIYLVVIAAAFFFLAALKEQVWTLFLYVVDITRGTHNEPVHVRDKMRAAKACERRREWKQAGQLYEEVEKMTLAAEAYKEAREWDSAARVLEAAGNLREAAKMHEKAGSYEAAAELYTKLKDEPARKSLHQRAGDRALAEGRLRPAAEHFMQAGQLTRGAELLERLEHFSEAAEIFLKDGGADRAAKLYDLQVKKYEEALASGNPPPGGLSKITATQARAGEVFEAAGRFKEAAEIAEKLNDWPRAGSAYAKAGLHDKASECFLKANDPTSAKQSMRMTNNSGKLKELDAMEALELKNYKKASELFLQLDMIEKAIDAARRGRDYESMGRIYEKTGRFVTAAEQYSMARKFDKAADMYEKGKDYRQAAEIYEQIGQIDKAIECLEIRRDFYTAGELHKRQGNVRKAIACYQRIDRSDPNYQKTCAALGDLFTREGQYDQAASYFEKALGEGTPSEELMDSYYQLARALEQNGRPQDAGRHYKRVMEMDYSFRDAGERYTNLKRQFPQLIDSGSYSSVGAGGAPASGAYRSLGGPNPNPANAPTYDLSGTHTSPGFVPPPPAGPQPGVQPLQSGSAGWGNAPTPYPQQAPNPRDSGSGFGQFGGGQYGGGGPFGGGGQQQQPYGPGGQPSYGGAPGPTFGAQPQQPPYGNPPQQQQPFGGAPQQNHSPQFAPTQMVRLVSAQPAPSDNTDRYELLEEIGRGGMGAVYKARDKTLDRIVALKLLAPALFASEGRAREIFLREARAIARLRHQNIVAIYDAGSRGDQFYISMEYVEGMNLRHYVLDNGIPPLARTISILMDVGQALKHAHAQGVVHRDIKPGNILIETHTGQAKLVDFGLAKVVGDVTVATGMVDPQTLQGGFVMGTPQYMAPEQIRGEAADQRADIYALGLTFYFLLIGQQLFDRFGCRSPMEIVEKQLNMDLPSPRQVNPALPREIDIVYYSCVEKDRNRRFASMDQVMAQLSAIPVDGDYDLGN